MRLLLLLALPLAAQRFTAADYGRAERFLSYNTNPLVYHSDIRPTWIDGDRFWYRNVSADGSEFVMIERGSRSPAFDHAKIAAALSAAAGKQYGARHLPFTEFDLKEGNISFNVERRRWTCDIAGSKCTSTGDAPRRGRG